MDRPCPAGKERNAVTKRCRKKCPKGTVRSSHTNRCIKGSHNSPARSKTRKSRSKSSSPPKSDLTLSELLAEKKRFVREMEKKMKEMDKKIHELREKTRDDNMEDSSIPAREVIYYNEYDFEDGTYIKDYGEEFQDTKKYNVGDIVYGRERGIHFIGKSGKLVPNDVDPDYDEYGGGLGIPKEISKYFTDVKKKYKTLGGKFMEVYDGKEVLLRAEDY